MDISKKTVLVTGGAVRIGKAITKAFAAAGARLLIHYDESEKEAGILLDEIGRVSTGHRAVECDFSLIETLDAFWDGLGNVDVLINNASIFKPEPVFEESMADFERQFMINFHAPAKLMELFAAQKPAERCVINLLDQRISRRPEKPGSYWLSKKALAEYTRGAALRMAPRVRVNGVAPGAVLPPRGMEQSHMKKEISLMPLKKAPCPEDVADACLFLAGSNSITGQIIFVDSGQNLIRQT